MLAALSLACANSANSFRHAKKNVIALSYRVLQNRFTGPNLVKIAHEGHKTVFGGRDMSCLFQRCNWPNQEVEKKTKKKEKGHDRWKTKDSSKGPSDYRSGPLLFSQANNSRSCKSVEFSLKVILNKHFWFKYTKSWKPVPVIFLVFLSWFVVFWIIFEMSTL